MAPTQAESETPAPAASPTTRCNRLRQPLLPLFQLSSPLTISRKGPARNPEHALRDPFIYEGLGRTWLIYAIAGESGLALAELQ